MLMNSLSLDEEDAVQAELKKLQQEAVSSLPYLRRIARTAHHNIAISYILSATKKHRSCSRTLPSPNLCPQNRVFLPLILPFVSLTYLYEELRQPQEETRTERVAIPA